MLHLHAAERIGPLARELAAILADPPSDPFAPEWIATPSVGVRRWLRLELARHLGGSSRGGDGVAANIVDAFPGTLRTLVLQAGRDGDEPDPWELVRLTWTVLEVLADAEQAGEPLAPVVAPGASAYSRARRLADLFDRYHLHRPEMVRGWAEGAGDPLLPTAQRWQPELWRRVRARLAAPSPPERLPELLQRLRTGGLELPLPPRLSLFGAAVLPGGAGFGELAAAVASQRELHVFLLQPSLAAWRELRGGSAGRTGVASPVRSRSDDRTVDLLRHPLLRSWSGPTRETAVLVGDLVRSEPSTVVVHEPGPAAPVDTDTDTDHDTVATPTVLARLQDDIRANRAPTPLDHPDPGDRSVQVHATFGPARQVEALRDALLHLLAADPTLSEDDIVVLCPALDRFAPLIEAGLGPSAGRGVAAPPTGHAPALRYRLADRSLRASNPVAAALAALVDLAGGRFDATGVLDLLAQPAIRQRHGFTDDDLGRIADWVAETNVRWGLHPDQRARHGVPAVITANTWRAGVDRILLGVAVADDDPCFTLGDVVPLGAEADDAELVGRLADLLTNLVALDDATTSERPLEEWLALLRQVVRATLAAPADARWQEEEVERIFQQIEQDASTADGPCPVPLAFVDVCRLLTERLAPGRGRPDFFRGGITVTALDSLRAVPHRVVALMGMDQSAFTAPAAPADDLAALSPLLGDRDGRAEQRQAVLDAVLAAGDHLVVVRDGRDLRTNQEIPPAVVVAELLDVVAATVPRPAATDDPGAAASEPALEVHHPRQPFDDRCFTAGAVVPGRVWSFDRGAFAGAQARRARTAEAPPFLAHPLPAEPVGVIELADLHRMLANPVQSFLQDRLQLRLPEAEDALAVRLPVDVTGLDQWWVGDRLLTTLLEDGDPDRWQRLEEAVGTLPPGRLGREKAAQILTTGTTLRDAAWAAGVGTTPPVLEPVDVTLPDGTRIVGAVPCRLQGAVSGPSRVGFGKAKPKYRLAAWLDLMALVANDPERPWHSVAVYKAEKTITRAKVKYDQADVADLVPVGETASDRLASAHQGLAVVVDLWRRSRCEPLPLFPSLSPAVHAGRPSAKAWFEPPRPGWELGAGDRTDRWISVVYGRFDHPSLMDLAARPHDPEPDETAPAGRVHRYASYLWTTVDATADATVDVRRPSEAPT